METGEDDLSETVSAGVSADGGMTPERKPVTGSPSTQVEVSPGDCLGRYTVRELIGAGGMGRVFAADDPELGRTVALKIIRPDRVIASPRSRARLLREAQALARLHHPNVVTVYDVGSQGDQVFIAMELIDGTTLARWLREKRRGWREVVGIFLAAGRGLAAAHSVGIVHRDVKPENVIVGKDRVVVVDFGLARAGAEDDGLDVNLTLTGEQVGTPAYMAPEQREGGTVTTKADQFSFCVALWGALHGAPPPSDEMVATAPSREIPGWVNAAVMRGLARDPAARWPSMDALLRALARDPARMWRRVLLASAMVALGVAATWGWVRSQAIDPCRGAAARLGGVWDATRKQAVRTAFAETKLPFSEDAWRRAGADIDDYAGRWVDMAVDACRATRVDGRQSDTLMDLRMACLDRRREVLGALTGLWARGMDGDTLAAAIDAAGGLPPLSECSDASALAARAPAPSDPAAKEKVAATRTRLALVEALILANRWAEARTAAAPVRADAEATGWPQIRAEAAFAEGEVLWLLDDPGAEPLLLDSARWAGVARDDRLVARALVALVSSLAEAHQNAGRALLVADIADGVVARAGDDDRLRVSLFRYRAQALMIQGKHDAARSALIAAMDRATAALGAGHSDTLAAGTQLARLAQAQGNFAEARRLGEENLTGIIALVGPDHPRVAQILINLGTYVTYDAGDYDAAAGYYRRALAIQEKSVGPESASIALTLNNFGGVELQRGHLNEAAVMLERALAVRERVLGTEHAFVAQTLHNLAIVRRKQGRSDDALALLRRGLAIRTKTYGQAHASVALPLSGIGNVLEVSGDIAGALDYYRRALELRKQVLGANHPDTLQSTNELGRALALSHRCAEARPLVVHATAALEKSLGGEHPYVAEGLVAGAHCDLAEGQPARAVAAAERALAILDKAKSAPVDRGPARWLLARALSSQGRRDDAITTAQKAERELAEDGDGARDRTAALAWLAARTR